MPENSLAERSARAAQSAGRAAGYCWLEHPDGGAHCTRPPHTGQQHVDYYNGRTSPTDTNGHEWEE
ncbi:hypothetical protein ACIPSA_46335 [Streptomyces sp. NPDC086549]|uniref:hypothetical protein n=1 Tax=Streptomyces sp. NPDC086549 TaxID=3365752 RepID=UPI0038155DC5